MKGRHLFVVIISIILIYFVGVFAIYYFVENSLFGKMCEYSIVNEISSEKFTASTLSRGCGVGSSDYAFVNVRKTGDTIEDSDNLSDEQVFLQIDSDKQKIYWKDDSTLVLSCDNCLIDGVDKANSKTTKTFESLKIEYQQEISKNPNDLFGYIPDEKTAIEIALKVWIPIYGKETIENEKPYRAILKDGVWTVYGSLPEGMDGGVASAQISRKDGKILKIIHGK